MVRGRLLLTRETPLRPPGFTLSQCGGPTLAPHWPLTPTLSVPYPRNLGMTLLHEYIQTDTLPPGEAGLSWFSGLVVYATKRVVVDVRGLKTWEIIVKKRKK